MTRPYARAGRKGTPLFARAATAAAGLLDRCGFFKLHFQRQGGLRILCYHGVCDDAVGDAPWLPPHFVTAGQFARQLDILTRFGPVLHLPDALAERPRSAAFALTFDDVAACVFTHARPLLAERGLRATFFIATGHVTSGRLLVADVARLLRWNPELLPPAERGELAWLLETPGRHKRLSVEQLARLDAAESVLRAGLAPEILDTLRPLTWDEVAALAGEGHEIAPHTVDHAVLGWQTDEVRRRQVRGSVGEITRRLGRPPRLFAYPNGGPGDFGSPERRVLAELQVRYAVTTRPGFVDGHDPLALPRVGIGREHGPERFAAEISGFLDIRRQRQQGWR